MSAEIGADRDRQIPVNTVRVSDSGKQFIVENCVRCGDTHYHGAMDRTVAEGGRSHRASHCGDGLDGGYYLELDHAAEPPAHWWRRVGVEQ